jgi:hypothetical protein
MNGRETHDTGLGGRIDLTALEVRSPENLGGSSDSTNFGVACGIVGFQDFVVSGRNDLPAMDDAGTERSAVPSTYPSISFLEGELHESAMSIRHAL